MRLGETIKQINKLYWFGLMILAGLVVLVLLVSGFTKPYTYNGSSIDPPQPAPDFSIKDTQGQTFSLSAQKGKITLLFFGYASCPDECPTTLAVLKQVKAGLGKNADRVGFVFITIDPVRDTPPVLQAYLEKFDPSLIGITGMAVELQPIWQSYGVYVDKTMDLTGSGYTLTHSTRVYLVDAQGNFHLTYSYGTSPDDILRDIQHLLG
jgi:protein SCO1/2